MVKIVIIDHDEENYGVFIYLFFFSNYGLTLDQGLNNVE